MGWPLSTWMAWVLDHLPDADVFARRLLSAGIDLDQGKERLEQRVGLSNMGLYPSVQTAVLKYGATVEIELPENGLGCIYFASRRILLAPFLPRGLRNVLTLHELAHLADPLHGSRFHHASFLLVETYLGLDASITRHAFELGYANVYTNAIGEVDVWARLWVSNSLARLREVVELTGLWRGQAGSPTASERPPVPLLAQGVGG